MRILEGINFFLSTYGRLFVGLFKVRLWPPFLILLVLLLLVVFVTVNMYADLFAGWAVPLMKWLTDDAVVHYPQHLVLLPVAFQWLSQIVSVLFQSLLMAAAILMFAAYWGRDKFSFGSSLAAAFKKYHKLLLVWIVVFIPVFLLFEWLPDLFRSWFAGSPRRMLALTAGMQALAVPIESLFIFVVPYMMLRDRSLGKSFTGSFRLFFSNFFLTLFFVGIPQLILLVPVLIVQWVQPDILQYKYNPDIMVWLTVMVAVTLVFVSYFTTGAIVRLFLQTAEE